MTAADLYDTVAAALYRHRWRLSRPFRYRRHILWLTGPVVELRDARGVISRWEANRHVPGRGYGFTRRQARHMRRALILAMREESALLEAAILARIKGLGGY